MKIRNLLKIQQAFETKTIPEDILEEENYYYSESKKEYIKILDLDLHHLIRILIKELDFKELDSTKGEIRQANNLAFKKLDISIAIGRILNEVEKVQKVIND